MFQHFFAFGKKYWKFIKVFFFCLVCLWLFSLLKHDWVKHSNFVWEPKWNWLFISALLYVMSFLPAAIFWRLALGYLGQKKSLVATLYAYYLGLLGKYVPGKAAVVVIRAGTVSSSPKEITFATVSVFYETLTMMGTGAFLAALLLGLKNQQNLSLTVVSLGCAILALVPLLPPIFTRLLKVLKVVKNQDNVNLSSFTYKRLIGGCLFMFPVWLLLGLSLWSLICGIGISTPNLTTNLLDYVMVVALSMTLGFVIIISPGGIGVREFVLTTFLTPMFFQFLELPGNAKFTLDPETIAALVAISQRVLTIIAEVIVAFLLIFLKKIVFPLMQRFKNECI